MLKTLPLMIVILLLTTKCCKDIVSTYKHNPNIDSKPKVAIPESSTLLPIMLFSGIAFIYYKSKKL